MGFLKKIFGKDEEVTNVKVIEIPKETLLKICESCGEEIDISFHKYTKRNGKYFHKVCWKRALRIAKQNRII